MLLNNGTFVYYSSLTKMVCVAMFLQGNKTEFGVGENTVYKNPAATLLKQYAGFFAVCLFTQLFNKRLYHKRNYKTYHCSYGGEYDCFKNFCTAYLYQQHHCCARNCTGAGLVYLLIHDYCVFVSALVVTWLMADATPPATAK